MEGLSELTLQFARAKLVDQTLCVSLSALTCVMAPAAPAAMLTMPFLHRLRITSAVRGLVKQAMEKIDRIRQQAVGLRTATARAAALARARACSRVLTRRPPLSRIVGRDAGEAACWGLGPVR